MHNLFISLFSILFISSGIFYVCFKSLDEYNKPTFWLKPLYVLTLFYLIYDFTFDYKEFVEFNNLLSRNIIEVRFNDVKIDWADVDLLYRNIKKDEFTWFNHPQNIKKSSLVFLTNKRKYNFEIWNTSNQGILVIRYGLQGNIIVTYMCNDIDYFLSKY